MPSSELISQTQWASFWEDVSIGATALVFLGVLLESVELDVVAKALRIDRHPQLRKQFEIAGLFILLLALAAEVPAVIVTRRINEEVMTSLNGKLSKSLQHEEALTRLTQELGLSNKLIESRLKSLTSRNEQLQREINIAKSRQSRMREVITPRDLSKSQLNNLISKCRKYSGISFDVMVSNDPDSEHLAELLGTSLEQAGWTWKHCPDIGNMGISFDNKHDAAIIALSGISIEFAASRQGALGEPSSELRAALERAGIHSTLRVQPDKRIDKAFDRRTIHISVGSKD